MEGVSRYAKAIKELGDDSPAIRLGGIHALERIAENSQRDRQPILDVLWAYLRSESPLKKSSGAAAGKMKSDAAAAAVAAGRITHLSRPTKLTILPGVNLSGAILDGADLSDASFDGANLTGASFDGANLDGASFIGADLTGASLNDANLNLANLNLANLSGVDLIGADLSAADLTGANLTGAGRINPLFWANGNQSAITLGPQMHAYRRIKKDDHGLRIAVKEYYARFEVMKDEAGDEFIRVHHIESGRRAEDQSEMDRIFTARFPR